MQHQMCWHIHIDDHNAFLPPNGSASRSGRPRPALTTILANFLGAISLVTLTVACSPPNSHYSPLADFYFPLCLDGTLFHLGTFVGLSPYVSVNFYSLVLVSGIGWLWLEVPKTLPASET